MSITSKRVNTFIKPDEKAVAFMGIHAGKGIDTPHAAEPVIERDCTTRIILGIGAIFAFAVAVNIFFL